MASWTLRPLPTVHGPLEVLHKERQEKAAAQTYLRVNSDNRPRFCDHALIAIDYAAMHSMTTW